MSYTMTMTQQQQHQQQHQQDYVGPNIRSNDVRYRRVGGDAPYRDDPNAPVHLESYTRGGLGPPQSDIGDDKKKNASPSSYYGSYNSGSPLTWCLHVCFSRSRLNNEEGPDGKYYRDDFNDMSWSCSLGTSDDHGIWLNQSDPAGTIMAMMVWILLCYSALTIALLAQTGGISAYFSFAYSVLCCLALACHAKTTLTDPGSVPPSAVPTEEQRKSAKLAMCSQCQTFKPPMSHHCRICNRCISRMDHHCPWMNNCVGAGNMKHFLLFLIYTWTCSVFSLLLLGWNYFFCASDECEFNVVLVQLVRIMTFLSVGAFLFTSSMLMNVIYGMMTGIGTIDRLKKKASNTMHESEEEPIPITDIFGIGPLYTWPFPIDPTFDDFDRIMGFSTHQRLLREQILREQATGGTNTGTGGSGHGGVVIDIPRNGGTGSVQQQTVSV